MKIAAVIPTRFHPPQLEPLVALLEADGVDVILLESESFGHRIYRGWNEGVKIAQEFGAEYVAILNDDITVLPGTLPLMADALRLYISAGIVYPDVRVPLDRLPSKPYEVEHTEGTWGAGGMTGFCFMFHAGTVTFDECYHWWYGDDDFEERMRASGKSVCRIIGLPIGHRADGSAGRVMDELGPLIVQDRALWESRHV
jgi:hypothetical protein